MVENRASIIKNATQRERERDDVDIICVKIYDDLTLEAWTQGEKERERECVCVCVCVCVCL